MRVDQGRRRIAVRPRRGGGAGRGRAGHVHGGAVPRVRARDMVQGIPLVEVGPALIEARGRDARTGPRARFHVPQQEGRGGLPSLGD